LIKVYIDGASVGNPGKCGIGYLIYEQDKCLKKKSVYLGIQSNNFAEYMALIFSLSELISLKVNQADFFSDSKLVCEQIKGNFKVKNQNIYPLYVLAKSLISKLDNFTITHIEREKNQEADRLAKDATGFLV